MAKSIVVIFSFVIFGNAQAQSSGKRLPPQVRIVLDDFESYSVGGLPTVWQTYQNRKEVRDVSPRFMNDKERFIIKEENGDHFVRAIVHDEAHRILQTNNRQFKWDVRSNPVIHWKWRAIELPENAREDKHDKNDTGAAVYVIFNKDWLGRPRSIKYTYSSTLPVGTRFKEGPLRGIVISSQASNGLNTWITEERNVVEDFKSFFGKNPPNHPISVMLWSDSDTVNGTAIVDFDDIELLTAATK